ncbi:serine/threonine-protein kinase [Roseibacillus persicicus]|uniref:serine/threonine protein kinase n=1 Tax=Roseibacillus persicicus TaxID=454148 RepID=UPI00398B2216
MPPSSQFVDLYDLADQVEPATERQLELSPLYQALKSSKIRYTRWESIGIGGMKEVFRVQDQQMERLVALARPKKGFQPERYDAFLREAHITARLDHPNIIKLFDMGIDEQERPYFTMEFKRGQSLRAILKSLKTNEEDSPSYSRTRLLTIFVRVCEAVSYAHSRHVLHLDLKPENIQVGPFGEVQVCDWGMGEIEHGESEEHLSEALLDPDLYGGQLDPAIKGTPGYMAPEQENPMAPKTPQNDIFALGCILYELVTLRSPSHRDKTPPISPALAAIVSKACAQKPLERYESVEELLDDVNLHLTGRSPKVEQAGFFREARLFYRRNKISSLVALGSCIVLLGAGLWFTQQLRVSYKAKTAALAQSKLALSSARREKQEADLARKNAEEALMKYQQEREFSSLLIDRQSESVLDGTLLLIDNLVMHEAVSLTALDNAMEEMDKVLATNPPANERLWTLKAYTLFMQQRFAETEPFYQIREGDQSDLRNLAREFAPKLGENGLLPVDDFLDLLTRLAKNDDDVPPKRDRSPFMEKLVIYDSLRRNNQEETARIIEHLLRISNKYWTTGLWDYDLEENALTVQGDHLYTFYRPRVPHRNSAYPNLCLLRLLHPKSLTLKTKNLRGYKQLTGLDLQKLDIRQGPQAPLTPLLGMKSLQELVVEEGQFTAEELGVLPDSVRIIEVKPATGIVP